MPLFEVYVNIKLLDLDIREVCGVLFKNGVFSN